MNRSRQKELSEHIAEQQLALRTLSTLVKGRSEPSNGATPAVSARESLATGIAATTPPTAIPNSFHQIQTTEKKGLSREKLKTLAFPYIQSKFADEPFEVSRIRDLLDELEPEIPHTYEGAWNLCNDLLREGRLKQAGIRKLPKGIVRLFVLKSPAGGGKPVPKENPVLAEG